MRLSDEQISILLSNQDYAKFIDEVIKQSKIDAKKDSKLLYFINIF